MLKRGDDFIKSGDLSTARLLLRRAAEAGEGNAALTLAGTFDPNVLKALGFRDAGDIAMARLWYERAGEIRFGGKRRSGFGNLRRSTTRAVIVIRWRERMKYPRSHPSLQVIHVQPPPVGWLHRSIVNLIVWKG